MFKLILYKNIKFSFTQTFFHSNLFPDPKKGWGAEQIQSKMNGEKLFQIDWYGKKTVKNDVSNGLNGLNSLHGLIA